MIHQTNIPRRSFLKMAGGTASWFGIAQPFFLDRLPKVHAAEAVLDPKMVRLHPEIEPLVRLLEETPRERVLEEIGQRIRRGLTYRETLAALLLAGVRNIQPRPVGFKFHAVLVVNSAHLASLASPDADRWLPIFWAIDYFKGSQAADVKEGDWSLPPVQESSLPPAHRARKALLEALDNWDEAATDVAVASMVRAGAAHDLFEIFCRYGVRDFREIGHKAIYVSNSFRALEVIGWHHAEPVLRSLAYALLDRDGEKANPAQADLPADRPFRKSLEVSKTLRGDWFQGQNEAAAVPEIAAVVREGSALEAGAKAAELLNRGVAPQTLFDAYHCAAGELLMQAPGILALHAVTFSNAVRYAYEHTWNDETRRLLILQNAAFLPLFRGRAKDKGIRIHELEPMAVGGNGNAGLEDIFAEISHDRLAASRKILGYLKSHPDPKPFVDAARRMIFLKGRDSHDYKYSSAVLEDYLKLSPQFRDAFLCSSAFNFPGANANDNEVVQRTRAALS